MERSPSSKHQCLWKAKVEREFCKKSLKLRTRQLRRVQVELKEVKNPFH
jgi:hypothetical protein